MVRVCVHDGAWPSVCLSVRAPFLQGVDAFLDADHTNEKTFTLYPDGQIYVTVVDANLKTDVRADPGQGRSTFIHPINALSDAGFTLATNYSMNALNLWPRGGGVAKWLLQWGQVRGCPFDLPFLLYSHCMHSSAQTSIEIDRPLPHQGILGLYI